MSYLGSFYHCARFTLETLTPLSIATGNSNGIFDTQLVRDANGLPAIPGTTIAGVLRHLYWKKHGESEMQQLFGYQDQSEGSPSLLNVSWGAMQNAKGKAIQGLCLGDKRQSIESDPILKQALDSEESPLYRDRVRINHHGVAEKNGKFDRAILPAGYRFSVEISRWSDEENDSSWSNVLQLLAHPFFRLGGSTRAGLGKVELKNLHKLTLNLKEEPDRKTFTKISRDLNDHQGFSATNLPKQDTNTQEIITAEIELTPNSYWRIGQGDKPTLERDNPARLLPKLEQKIDWDNADAKLSKDKLIIPASSIKGALSHRIAFHYNCFEGVWAEECIQEDSDSYSKEEDCEAVKSLFGVAKDEADTESNKGAGQVGNILIDDTYLSFSADDNLQLITHNSIDRFSGSVREHMLFTEEMVWGKKITINLAINNISSITSNTKKALIQAIQDLCEGRLAIGAGVSKGHGFCSGAIKWSDKGTWANQQEADK